MKNIKVIASDLDGTLLLSKNYIGAFTSLVIRQLIKEGKKFIIATGRSKNEITHLIEKGNKLNVSFFITLNGAKIYDQEWKSIKSHNISPRIIKEILILRDNKYGHFPHFLNTIDQYDDKIHIDTKTKIAIDKSFNEKSKKESNHSTYNLIDPNAQLQEINDFCNLKNFENVAKITLFGEEKDLVEYETMILNKYKGKISAYLTAPNSLDLVDYNVSKGNALKEVLKSININLSETIAFGDSFNDADMLKNVKKGLLMRNANYRLKAMLSYLETIGTNDEEAVAKYINNNVLQEPI